MHIYTINSDIKVFYVTAESFPDGIEGAFRKLLANLPDAKSRTYYGISNESEKGVIIYKAAVEESFPGEAEKYGFETFVIKKGDYICETIIDWQKDVSIIGKTFTELLKDPRIDKNGYCLEIYTGENKILCLVGIN